jgi:hypothetical protein
VHKKKIVLGVSVLAIAGAAGIACSSSSTNPATGDDASVDDAGTSSGTSSGASSSGTSSGASSSGTSSGGTVDAGDAGDAGGDAGTSFYTALGGHAGIRKAVHVVVVAELADPTIVTYFFNQVNAVPGHPNQIQIEECFTDLLASGLGGTEVYPYTVGPFNDAGVSIGDGGAVDGGGTWTCRDMAGIHQPLKISGPTFDYFISVAATVLTSAPYNLKTTDPVFAKLANLLAAPKPDIVDSKLPTAGDAGPYQADAQ